MYCTNCDNPKKLNGRKVNHRYVESGLENVTLIGVTEYRCAKCGELYRGFGDIKKLHSLITNILLTKEGHLDGKEIRFLRTQVGYSGAYFSRVLGVKPETLSRIENRKQPVIQAFDRHVREAIFNKTPDRNYDLHDAILQNPTVIDENIILKAKNLNWVPQIKVSPLLNLRVV